MATLWQQIIKGEKGQALPIVLILLVLGGLLIAPSLNYASTSLNAGLIVEKNVKGVYAADAGVENALWCLKNSIPPPVQLPEPVNQMDVAIITEGNEEIYTLYLGERLKVTELHYDSLAVYGEMEWIEEETYKYTITVTRLPEAEAQTIHLAEVGVRLPIGYGYIPGSANDPSFADDNLSTDEPVEPIEQDGAGAYMLNWEFGPPYPDVSGTEPIRSQTFYVTGEGGQGGDYTWVEARLGQSIGIVGEVIGTLYRITATATRPEGDEITVVADVIVNENETEREICVILWQINPV